MAAKVIERILKQLADGDLTSATVGLEALKANDPAIAKTPAFKDAESVHRYIVDSVKNKAGKKGLNKTEIAAAAKEAYKEAVAVPDAEVKTKATAKAPDTSLAASAEELPPADTTPPKRTPLQSPGSAATAPASTKAPKTPSAAPTGTGGTSPVTTPSQPSTGSTSTRPRLSPAAARLVDDMAAATTRTGSALTAGVQERLRGMGPLDPRGALARSATLGQGARLGAGPVVAPTLEPGPSTPLSARPPPSRIPASWRTMAPNQLLQGLAPSGQSLAAATDPIVRAQAAQMEALAATAAQADTIGDNVRGRGASRIPGLAAAPGMADDMGNLLPMRERFARSGKWAKAGLRGGVPLVLGSLVADPVIGQAEKQGLSPTLGNAARGAVTGAGIGAAVGAPVFGIGAGAGALIGGGLGGLIGALRGGGGGSKGDFDEASIMALPGLSDFDKQGLLTEYRFMQQMGIPKKEAGAQMQAKAMQRFQQSMEEQRKYETVMPNVMALQALTASYAAPYVQDYRAANDVQHSLANQMVGGLPADQRAAAANFANQQYAQGQQTAAAFGNTHLLAPAFFLQDALKQNAYSSGAPPLGGLGLSGGMGVQGGGGAVDLKQLLAASGR